MYNQNLGRFKIIITRVKISRFDDIQYSFALGSKHIYPIRSSSTIDILSILRILVSCKGSNNLRGYELDKTLQ